MDFSITRLVLRRHTKKDRNVRKRPIFFCYDVDKDQRLLEPFTKILGRPDSPFVLKGQSAKLTEPARTWEYNTGQLIHQCEIVILIVGQFTFEAPGVLKEVAMAVDEEIPIIQIAGYKNVTLKPVRGAGQVIPWNWEALKKMI